MCSVQSLKMDTWNQRLKTTGGHLRTLAVYSNSPMYKFHDLTTLGIDHTNYHYL